jgi:multidrug transporter EmrE-like cation transporter
MRSALLLVLYAVCVTASNSLVKVSSDAAWFWPFILPFAAGNIAGLCGVLLYTLLLRRMPLHAAFPLTRGVGVLGVQLAASVLFFHERLRPTEIAAAVVVTAGIVLVGVGSAAGAGPRPVPQGPPDPPGAPR